ncbi:MAG: nitrogen regulation protein NR(II) [Planctomycetota bacterium]
MSPRVPLFRTLLLAAAVALAVIPHGPEAMAAFVPAGIAIGVAVGLEGFLVRRGVLALAWSLAFAVTALGLVVVEVRDEAPSLDRLALLLLAAVVATSRNQVAGLLAGLMGSGGLVYVALSQELGRADMSLFALGLLLLGAGAASGFAYQESDETASLREELADVSEHLHNVLACVASGVLVIDLEGRVTIYNRAAARILGVPEHVVIGRSLGGLPSMGPLWGTVVAEPSTESGAEERQTIAFERPDGRRIQVGYALSTLENRAGRRLGTILVFQDVTLIRDYEQRMIRQEQLAALGRLVSGIAHEFGNQLGGAKGLLDLALLDEPQEAVKSLPTVRDTLVRSLETVANLLGFARGRPLNPVPGVLVADVLERALSLLRAQIDDARLVVEREGSAPRPVVADAVQLEQVFLNLIINAIHATSGSSPPRLRVTLSETAPSDGSPAQTTALFEDNGPGVPAEARARIFEPFFTTKGALGGSEVPGTGLGLSVALGIVEGHRGRLEVSTSADLGGACFAVRLPSTNGEGEDPL